MWGIIPQGNFHSGLICFPIQSPRILQSEIFSIFDSTMTWIFGFLLSSMCRPQRGAQPVNAVAKADNPDSLFVINEVYELEKQTALDSAQEPMPSVKSIPLS